MSRNDNTSYTFNVNLGIQVVLYRLEMVTRSTLIKWYFNNKQPKLL